MRVHEYQRAPAKPMAHALEVFEKQFTYPLGGSHSFRISHGEDYPRFFRAIGEASCFVAEQGGCVFGTLGAMVRSLLLPDGQEKKVAYFADLKVAPGTHRGRTLYRLMRSAGQWMDGRASAAFGVVMDGTRVTPERYTGRLGFPLFEALGQVVILRVPVNADESDPGDVAEVDCRTGETCYRQLSRRRYGVVGGNPRDRSRVTPAWFCSSDRLACGRLEDTYEAKRLIDSTEREMKSAHLSSFAFADVAAGACLIRCVLARARQLGFPTVYVPIYAPDVPHMMQSLGKSEIVLAPATIYGSGIEAGWHWNINSAEI